MSLLVDITHRQGGFTLDASFESSASLIALFGASGSGKTTLINMIAGLVRPDRGRVIEGGRVLVDTQSHVFVAMHRRRIGYVFQEARLFPHLSVRQNLRYGRFFTPPAERYAEFGKVVELLGIGHLLDRRPSHLSGGEKQRVAIGRALIASPRLLLMDEPLASLDEGRKAEILPYLERLRDESRIPIVYVSHSVAEVARLASEVVVLSAGTVSAKGPTRDIMERLDLLPDDERGEGGSVIDAVVMRHDLETGLTVLTSPAGEWMLPRVDAHIGTRMRLRVRARDVMVATERPRGVSALNIMPGVIGVVSIGGQDAYVAIDCGGDRIMARVTPYSIKALELAPGRSVFAVVKAVTFDRGNVPGPSMVAGT
ncbi:MAG: molybdenum ABC transporter ATP-binding protein [Rhizobiaceae bacterium]